MIQIIEVGSPAYEDLINKVISTTIQVCKKDLKQDDDLLTQKEAMALLKVKSKQKMQALRETGYIKFIELGGEFRYSKKSILDKIKL